MRSPLKAGLIALTAAALLAVPISAATAQGRYDGKSLDIVGLVDGTKIANFDTRDTRMRDTATVTGLVANTSLVGIDYRVQDGMLYGVGRDGTIYTIDSRTAKAATVGKLSVALDGTNFGVDFNPAANALRVVSDTGQNLRQSFAITPPATTLPGTVADTALTNPATPPAMGTMPATGVTGSAYTNNDMDTTSATTLFALDTTLDRIAIQSPANAGTLAPTGGLGLDPAANAGFDIYTTLRGGRALDNDAFATLSVNGRYSLYSIDLLEGTASRVGGLVGDVTDIAVSLRR